MAHPPMIDTQHLLAAWPIPALRNVRLTNTGTNNRSYIVDTVAGSYLLRVYQNTSDLVRIRYEHELLLQLRQAGLSFSVPLPLTATSGNTYRVAARDGENLVAALFPMIPGREPVRGDVAQAAICGGTLGELDQALASIEVESPFVGLPWFGQPGAVHALVPDPFPAIAQLPLAAARRQRLGTLLDELLACASHLYGGLPEQIIHGDFFPSNVLMRGNAVNGVLDFEFASPGPRAMDLAVALWGFGVSHWQSDDDWPLIEAFAAGYRRQVALSPIETHALPDLIRLREATSLTHWIGRFRQGLTTEPDIVSRTDRLLQVDEWMRAHGDELVRRVDQAAPSYNQAAR